MLVCSLLDLKHFRHIHVIVELWKGWGRGGGGGSGPGENGRRPVETKADLARLMSQGTKSDSHANGQRRSPTSGGQLEVQLVPGGWRPLGPDNRTSHYAGSIYMHHDAVWSIQVTMWPWPEVIFSSWLFEVTRCKFRRILTRETRSFFSFSLSLLDKKIRAKNPKTLSIFWLNASFLKLHGSKVF